MRKLRVSVKRYKRGSFTKDVLPGPRVRMKRIKGTMVKGHTKLVPDKGTPGRFRGVKWFKPKSTLRGWDKDLSVDERRRRASIGRSDLSSARALLALANVTKDRETKTKARQDAKYFFAKHKR